MDTNGYTTFKVDCSSLSPSAQTDIFRLIVRCIDDQRRLESAAQVITDNVVRHQMASVLSDLRSYRRVLADNMVEHFEPDVVQESIRIVEKAMLYVSSSTDEICLIAGK
ncbi:hypothetical protein L3Y34_011932 [Caenorhabditis briggsae]|uniref:Uncharacterized protein n=1 Tax=Caenorhabditis briggsae TaxID=6238 RepID=A0AAE8ZSP7_CAEBR|nr:hypothetical protein L3Y34_011932 [Caenorhabditis briggsae]